MKHPTFAIPVILLVSVCFLSVTLYLPGAQAAMIGTAQVVQGEQSRQERALIHAALERQEVRERLIALGVDPAHVRERVNALTDAEAHRLAAQLEQMPAGGNSVVGAIVFVFVLLLITDLLGWTNVFPFTKKGALGK